MKSSVYTVAMVEEFSTPPAESTGLFTLRVRNPPPPLGQVTRPVVHQDTPALKQVRAGIGRLDPVPDHMRQGRLDHLPGMFRLLPRPVPEAGPETVRHVPDPVPVRKRTSDNGVLVR